MPSALGVHVHQGVDVTGITVEATGVTGVDTSAGPGRCGEVVCAVGGYVTQIATMAGLQLPIQHPSAAGVRHRVVLAGRGPARRVRRPAHVLLQTARGEVVVGSEIEPYTIVLDPLDLFLPLRGGSRSASNSCR